MFKIESVETMPLTKELAVRMTSLKEVPGGDRKLNPSRIYHLERDIDSGLITCFRWVTANIKGSVDVYRINGQHTSTIFANGKEPRGTVVLEHYVCDSIDDVTSLWSRFDTTFSARGKADVLNIAFGADSDLRDLPIKQSRVAANAIAIAEFGFGMTNKVSHYDKAQAAVMHKDFICWACRMFPQRSMCLKVGALVAAFHTFSQDRDAATEFWREVESGENPDPYSGSRALQRLLLEYSARSGQGARNGKKSLRWDTMAELCMSAWHSWLSGKTVRNLRVSKVGLSRFIEIPKGKWSGRVRGPGER